MVWILEGALKISVHLQAVRLTSSCVWKMDLFSVPSQMAPFAELASLRGYFVSPDSIFLTWKQIFNSCILHHFNFVGFLLQFSSVSLETPDFVFK